MPDSELTINVDAQIDEAVETINEVTEAVNRLADALERLDEAPLRMRIDQMGDFSQTLVDTTASGEWVEFEFENEYEAGGTTGPGDLDPSPGRSEYDGGRR